MAFWIKDAFATFWKVEDKGNYALGRISTSNKQPDGTYENSNWNAKFFGKCKDKSLELTEKDRIKIISGKVSNTLYGEGDDKRSFLCANIFDFEILEPYVGMGNNSNTNTSDTIDEDELPFN